MGALSPGVRRALRTLGEDIKTARRKRRIAQSDLAARMGVSVGTVKRLEAGDPGVGLGSLAAALLAFGDLGRLASLISEASDDIGLLADHANLPLRIRRRRAGVVASPDRDALYSPGEEGALF